MVIKVGQSTWILVPNILVFYHFFKLLVNFSIFLNFLHFGEGEGEGDQKRLVGLRRASAAGKNMDPGEQVMRSRNLKLAFFTIPRSLVGLCVCVTDQVPVADDGKVVLGPHRLRLDAVEVAGQVDEPVVVLGIGVGLPVGGQCKGH